MANILIRGGDVLTMEPGVPTVHGIDVAIAGGLVVAVGDVPESFAPDQIVDARHHIVMPGLFNAHMHSGTIYSRGLPPENSLDPWFDLRITQDGQIQHEIESPLSADDAYWAALLVAAELIRGGVVGFGDQYFFMDAVARAALESGLRANLCWCTFGGEDGEIGGDIAAVATFAETWEAAGEGRIKTSLGPHSPYLCPPQFLARTAAVADRLGVGIHLRVSESAEQVDFSSLAYDMTPIEMLNNNGVLDVPAVCVNAAYLSEVDISILAARGACVVACPSAQRAARLSQTPIEQLVAAGVSVGLGTDGAGLVGSLDVFDAMRDAQADLRDGVAQRAEALRLATWGGAQVLGFTNSGVLAPGWCADLILIDERKAHLWPVHDPLTAVLTAARPGDVSDVMVGGNWLLRNGELTTIDEGRALAETETRAARLFGTQGREA
jgi:5-methylthioadenosine/S-adenosylhomocysteine deaminase